MYYFFLAIVIISYETTATARWALLFIVRAFFNDAITVAVWTGFHVVPLVLCPSFAGQFAQQFFRHLLSSMTARLRCFTPVRRSNDHHAVNEFE